LATPSAGDISLLMLLPDWAFQE